MDAARHRCLTVAGLLKQMSNTGCCGNIPAAGPDPGPRSQAILLTAVAGQVLFSLSR